MSIAAFLSFLVGTGPAAAHVRVESDQATLPHEIWAVEVTSGVAKHLTTRRLTRMRGAGVNVLVLSRQLRPSLAARVRTQAARNGMLAIAPRKAAAGDATTPACAAADVARNAGLCAVPAPSLAASASLAGRPGVDVVVLHLRRAADVKRAANAAPGNRLLVAPPFRSSKEWRAAVALARTSETVDVAARFAPAKAAQVDAYVKLVASGKIATVAGADTRRDNPSNLRATAGTETSISLAWDRPTRGTPTSYGLYVNGSLRLSTSSTNAQATGLTCGSRYTIEVDALWKNRRSARVGIAATTSACSGAAPGPAPTPDAQPPTQPSNLVVETRTATSVTLSWTAANDNVGVAGYDALRNGAVVGAASATSYTFAGLACGTTYTLGVSAYDAVGNRSGTASVSAATTACSTPPPADTTPPPKPTGLTMTGATDTSITLAWNPTTDNVGVAGHNLYRGGVVVGTTGPTTYTYTYTGLTCGTSYTLALEVFDAAGNRSLKEEATTVRSTLPCSAPPPPPPPPGGTLYVSPSGSDSNPCSLVAPCASFDRAYHAAQPNNTVEVLAGSYGSQSMTADSSKTSGAVVFQPAAGASPAIDRLYVEGSSYVTFRSLRFSSRVTVENTSPGSTGSTNVLFENVESQTFRIVGQVQNITVRGGSFGNTTDNQPQIKKYNPGDPDSSRPSNILIEGAYFHDFRRSGSAVHTECLQLIHSNTVTVRNSRFNNCDGTGDIGVTDGPHDNLTIENNFLGRDGDAYFSVQLTKNIRNLVFRYNSASKAVIFSDSDSGGPYAFVGNYMPHNASTCSSGVTYRYNVFEGGTCGSTDREVNTLRFVDIAGFDLHLAPDSEAIDSGDSASFPSSDIDGHGRSGAPDAGADER